MHPLRYAVNTVLNETEKKEVTELVNADVTGKWMPFTPAAHVREVWASIVEATETGRLGWAAKVATDHQPGKDVLICVYTKDWRDLHDVARVLTELRAMGIHQRLSYKEDAATNALRYGGGAALYVAQPGETTLSKRRNAYTSENQHPIFAEPEPHSVETVFARTAPYGPFPA